MAFGSGWRTRPGENPSTPVAPKLVLCAASSAAPAPAVAPPPRGAAPISRRRRSRCRHLVDLVSCTVRCCLKDASARRKEQLEQEKRGGYPFGARLPQCLPLALCHALGAFLGIGWLHLDQILWHRPLWPRILLQPSGVIWSLKGMLRGTSRGLTKKVDVQFEDHPGSPAQQWPATCMRYGSPQATQAFRSPVRGGSGLSQGSSGNLQSCSACRRKDGQALRRTRGAVNAKEVGAGREEADAHVHAADAAGAAVHHGALHPLQRVAFG